MSASKFDDEIEITAEMARAGAEVIGTADLTFTTADRLAREVYRVMEKENASRKPKQKKRKG